LQPALEALRDSGLDAAASAAKAGAAKTATMQTAGAGRSSYVNSESLEGVTDRRSGDCGVFAALAKGK
jgi:dihydroxyacetone kinase